MFIVQSPDPSALPRRPFGGTPRRLFDTPPRRLVKRVRSKRPPPGTRFKIVKRRMPRLQTPTPPPTVINNYYGTGGQPKRPLISKNLTLPAVQHFTQWYRPSTGSLVIGNAAGGSYSSAEGLLLGPNISATSDMTFSLTFRLTDLTGANLGNLTQIYDTFRIDEVMLEMNPLQNVTGNSSLDSAFSQVPERVITVIDYDDAAVVTQAQAEEYSTYHCTAGYEKHVRCFKPAVAVQYYKTSLLPAYGEKFDQWIDFDYSDAEHYGIKGIIPTSDHGSFLDNYRNGWYIRVRVKFSCKQLR